MAGLVLSGVYNYLSKPGHSVWYHALFGIKILLVLHVFSVAILRRRREIRDGHGSCSGGSLGTDHRGDFRLLEGDRLN